MKNAFIGLILGGVLVYGVTSVVDDAVAANELACKMNSEGAWPDEYLQSKGIVCEDGGL